MTKITEITAYQILDSRGNPTVRVELHNQDITVAANVPSGASTGKHEALELRDNTDAYHGKSVYKATQNVNTTIKNAVLGHDYETQEAFDQALLDLDGTENKSRLGANAILGCSIAFARLQAATHNTALHETFTAEDYELPTPYSNIINGGVHAGNNLAIQEFMIVPRGETFHENTRILAETYHELKALLHERHGAEATNVGDEGGFAPPLNTTQEAVELILEAAQNAGHNEHVELAIDAAAAEFYDEENNTYTIDDEHKTPKELLAFYEALITSYPITSLEDPFHDDDFEHFAALLNTVGSQCQIVGDDLTVSNPARVTKAVKNKSCSALLLKVNQIGTVTEAIQAAKTAMHSGWNVMVSHRSGETEDAFIADLAVGIGATQIKIGAPCRGERTAKYNRLLEIEHHLP